jgi:hypothetical protein
MPENMKAKSFDGILDGYAKAEQKPQLDEDDLRLVSVLKERIESAQSAKVAYEIDWEFYRCYLRGDQLIARNRETGEVVRLAEEDSKRLRSQNNILRPTSRSLVGKLARTIPTCVVVPATADFNEQHGAKVASALLEYARRKENLDVKFLETMEFLPWAGNGILQLVWNRFGGRKIGICPVCDSVTVNEYDIGKPCQRCSNQKQEEQALYQEEASQIQMRQEQFATQRQNENPFMDMSSEPLPIELMQQPEMKQIGPLGLDQEIPIFDEAFEGDVEIHVRDPRMFLIEPGAISLDKAQWCLLRVPMPVAEVRRMFPEYAAVIQKDETLLIDKIAEYRGSTLDFTNKTTYFDDHCYVYEFHEKPNEEYPKGRVVWMVNDMIVRRLDDSPYHVLGRFPFYHFGFDKNPGEFWHEGYIAQAWHRQRELNRLETQIRENTELALKPKMLNPIGSRINEDEITSYSNQIIAYNAFAGVPQILQFPQLPAQVFDRKMELASDIRTQASITEQEAGMSSNDPNGRAMAIVAAEADQQLGPILVRLHAEWRAMHKNYIQLFRAYASPDKVWSIAGPEGIQTFSFNELILEDGWDVQVEHDDGLSRNPAIRLRQSLELMQAGVFADPATGVPDIKAFMRHAKLNLPNQGYELEMTERAAASQVPYQMQKGIQYQPKPEDDAKIFAEELLGWLRGPGRKLEQENPELVGTVRQLWQYYVSWAVGGMMPAQEQQQPGMQGGAGVGGQDMSAPGGTPNNVGGIPTDVMQNATAKVGNADTAAEGMARAQLKQES